MILPDGAAAGNRDPLPFPNRDAESHLDERRRYAEFASRHGEDEYRERLADLYLKWREYNDEFFSHQLVEPHIAIGRTAPRNLGHCAASTDYGGKLQLTLNSGLVFGSNRAWVVRSWPPAEGTERFIDDLLLRLAVRQFVMEVLDDEEPGYRGFGPQFVSHANRIGTKLGLRRVVERRRGPGNCEPVATGWPHCVRPSGYYGDDVTEVALTLACGLTGRRVTATSAPSRGVLELILHLLTTGRVADAQRLLTRHLDWSRASRESRWRPRREVEAGSRDLDGSALGEVTVDVAWLRWNGGTVARIVGSINELGSFVELPILADALEEAGCTDGRILRHLRAPIEHTRRCWVLRVLLALGAG